MPRLPVSHPDAKLLAIDCATTVMSVALSVSGSLKLWENAVGTAQSDYILPVIGTLLNEAALTVADLDAIVYNQGPGSFTGLRIGVGVAQGLAFAHGIDLVAVPALEALAGLAPVAPWVLAATDARMGELFYAWFDTRCGLKRLCEDRVNAPDQLWLPEALETHAAIGIGNAFALGCPLPVSGSARMANAATLIALAQSGHYPPHDAAHAELKYVRNKIALTATEQAQLRADKTRATSKGN